MKILIIMNVRKPATLILTALLFAPLVTLRAAEKHPGQGTMYETVKYDPASAAAMTWWEDAKFGLFVHWGVYSVPGGIWSKDNTFKSRFDGDTNNWVEVKGYAEQILKGAQMPLGEYEKIAGIFDWSKFNAQDYIKLCFASRLLRPAEDSHPEPRPTCGGEHAFHRLPCRRAGLRTLA